jgi:hypothetical protein
LQNPENFELELSGFDVVLALEKLVLDFENVVLDLEKLVFGLEKLMLALDFEPDFELMLALEFVVLAVHFAIGLLFFYVVSSIIET